MSEPRVQGGSRADEDARRDAHVVNFLNTPIARSELGQNLGLYMNRQALSRILFMHDLYQRIIDVHGVIIEFGVRWGQNMALLQNFRGIYEPYNYSRRVIGFDTFGGFPETEQADGTHVSAGDYGVTEGYEAHLREVLDYHEFESPISHKKKYELVKGDATETFPAFLERSPEAIVAFAYFDFDLYRPTLECLTLLMDRVTKGTVIAFDELNCPELPGETIALRETLGLGRYAIRRSPLTPYMSYLVVD